MGASGQNQISTLAIAMSALPNAHFGYVFRIEMRQADNGADQAAAHRLVS